MPDFLICLAVALALVALVYSPAWLYKLYKKIGQRKIKSETRTGLTNVKPPRTDITYGQRRILRFGEPDADGDAVERKALNQKPGSTSKNTGVGSSIVHTPDSSFDHVPRQDDVANTYMGVLGASAASDESSYTPPPSHSPGHNSHSSGSSGHDHSQSWHSHDSGHGHSSSSYDSDSSSYSSDSSSSSSDSGGGGDD